MRCFGGKRRQMSHAGQRETDGPETSAEARRHGTILAQALAVVPFVARSCPCPCLLPFCLVVAVVCVTLGRRGSLRGWRRRGRHGRLRTTFGGLALALARRLSCPLSFPCPCRHRPAAGSGRAARQPPRASPPRLVRERAVGRLGRLRCRRRRRLRAGFGAGFGLPRLTARRTGTYAESAGRAEPEPAPPEAGAR